MTKSEPIAPFKRLGNLATATKFYLLNGRLDRAAKCFQIADGFMTEGSPLLRIAVANVFIYSLMNMMALHREWRRDILLILPASLKSEMQRQAHATGL